MRYLFLVSSSQPATPPPELIEAMHAMARREVEAGRMIQDGGLMPVASGTRLKLERGKLVVLDGPFSETKEVIGGFAIFELPDHAAAVASARDFMSLHLKHMPDWEGTCEVREIAGSQVEMIRAGR